MGTYKINSLLITISNNISIKKFHFLEEALEWEIPEEPKKLI